MKIDIAELKVIIDKVLEKLMTNNGHIIETDEDYYWCIFTEDSIDFSKTPENFGVGSIIDDYENLDKVIKEDRIINILDLDRIANLIKLISYEMERSSDKLML